MNTGKFEVIANGSEFKIMILFFLLVNASLIQAQSFEEERFSVPKRFIDKIEIFGGPSINFPDDHGWSEFIFKVSDGRTIEKFESKEGYFVGFGLGHSLGRRFEIQGKFAAERRAYSKTLITLDFNGDIYGESNDEQKSNYLTLAVVPTYFLSGSHKLHIFSGFSYAYITKSLVVGTNYIQGQYVGGASVNTIDGEKNVMDALIGVGYLFPLKRKVGGAIRIQGNHGLSYTSNQNNQKTSINSISLSLSIRYSR